jgi:hypothetical protein
LDIVRVPFSSPVVTTFPLPIYHTTTTISRDALRLWNLTVNYLPSPLELSSLPSCTKNVEKQSIRCHSMDDHSGPEPASFQPPPPHTVVQHSLAIISDVSSPTTEPPSAMLTHDDNHSFATAEYTTPAILITADHLAMWFKHILKKPIQNLTDLPELFTFNPLQSIDPSHPVQN